MIKAFSNPGTVVTVTANSAVITVDSLATQNQGAPAAQYLSVNIVATAVGGTTPSLAAELQWSNDGVNFASASGSPDTLVAITANGNQAKNFLTKGAFARLVYTVTGTTPTFTLSSTAYLS